jgi:ribosomal protein S18 acetylase RimI-like enzyme
VPNRVLEIRPFKTEDSDSVVKLWEQCGLVRTTNDPWKDITRKQKVRGDLFLLGLSEGAIVATVMAGYDGHRGWLNYVAVSPAHRKKGYGSQIVREAERLLLAEGCPKVNLQVRVRNEEAIKFYTAIGYSQDVVLSFGKRLEHDN